MHLLLKCVQASIFVNMDFPTI